jgi:hypothetical protein
MLLAFVFLLLFPCFSVDPLVAIVGKGAAPASAPGRVPNLFESCRACLSSTRLSSRSSIVCR